MGSLKAENLNLSEHIELDIYVMMEKEVKRIIKFKAFFFAIYRYSKIFKLRNIFFDRI